MHKAQKWYGLVFFLMLMMLFSTAMGLPKVGDRDLAASSGEFLGFHPSRLVIKFTPQFIPQLTIDTGTKALRSARLDEIETVLGKCEFTQLFKTRALRSELGAYCVIELKGDVDLEHAIDYLSRLDFIESVEPDPVLRASYTPNDSSFGLQWHHVQSADHDLDTPDEWNDGSGDSTVLIGIIDTGVLYDHPDLANNIWTNIVEASGTTGVDDDSNGYIDDVHGWDFVTSLYNAWPEEDASVADNDPTDFNGHGTHVAGIVGAVTNNGLGVAGIAGGNGSTRGVSIVPLRIGGSWSNPVTHVEEPLVSMSFAAEAIDYAITMGIDVINCSWGSYPSPSAFVEAVDSALAAGITLCVAAGNNNTKPDVSFFAQYLATLDAPFVVAALDSNDAKASFSNFGPTIDISAPGVDIYSTLSDHGTATYGYKSGTSMAAPMVAGVVGLLKSAYPSYSAAAIDSIIRNSADDITAANPDFTTTLGAGRLNAKKVVDYLHFVVSPRSDVYEDEAKFAGPDQGYLVSTKVITADTLIPSFLGDKVTLLYNAGGLWAFVSTTYSNGFYRGYIPHQSPGTTIQFKFTAQNSYGTRQSATHTFEVLSLPDLSYSPSAFVDYLEPGEVKYDTLLISNAGYGTLNYTLSTTHDSPVFSKLRQFDYEALAAGLNDRVDPAAVPLTNRTVSGEIVYSTPRDGARAAWTKFSPRSAADLNVAVLASEDYYEPEPLEDIQDQLLSTGEFNSVTAINTAVTPLTGDDLIPYDAVIVNFNYPFYDSQGFGDALADYCDAGGGVVLAGNAFMYLTLQNPESPYGISGRWIEDDYRVIKFGNLLDHCAGDLSCHDEYLGTRYYPNHPLFANVDDFYGGYYSDHFFIEPADLQPGSVRLANWTSGYVFAAARRLSENGFNRIDLNFYPVSDNAFAGQWPDTTDGALLMANALTFVANSWIALSQN